jgi:energy-coupling factor transporter ATP-binding protein EcfA2
MQRSPSDIIREALRSHRAVAFVGSRLSTAAGLPSRTDQFAKILERSNLSVSMNTEIRNAIDRSGVDRAMDMLISATSRNDVLIRLCDVVNESPVTFVPPIFESLSRIPFRHCISTTLDTIADAAFSARKSVVLDGVTDDQSTFSSVFSSDAFALVKLFGQVSHPESVRLSSAELRSFAYENMVFSKMLASIVSSCTVAFIGMELDDITAALEPLREVASILTSSGPHVAILPDNDKNRGLEAFDFTRKYGIEFWHYPDMDSDWELSALLEGLASEFNPQPTAPEIGVASGAPIPVKAERARNEGRLQRVHLHDIGPYEDLILDIPSDWLVILGDNGVGKSTILRAIALALCGDAGAGVFGDVGRRLLRSGSKGTGLIELTIDNASYRIDLRRHPGGVVSVTSPSLSPIQEGARLVLGFPAIRGVSMRSNASSSSGQSGNPFPAVDDVMPLVFGGLDVRLDSLRQWLINVEQRGQTPIRDAFFDIVRSFLPNLELRFAEIDTTTFDVLVWAGGEKVALEQLSQGMSSLLAWVGVTLQRLFEVYPGDNAPTEHTVLVLVDELDAHLHPEWQRQLVPIIRKHFPRLQMVATTHSPLIVSALTQESVVSARRDGTAFSVVRVEEEMRGLRSDQVLTSAVFGLESTRSVEFVDKSEELDNLIKLERLDNEQIQRKSALSAQLEEMTIPGDTLSARESYREAVANAETSIEKIAVDRADELESMLSSETAREES